MRKIVTTLSCILILMLLPGCWNIRELNTLSIVQAVGIDRSDDGQITVSLQILKPSAMKSTTTEKASGSQVVWVVTSKGKTVFDAIRNASLQTDRKAFFSFNMVYVLSEEVAREGIADELDFLSRDAELRKLPYVFITKRKAEDIIRSDHEQEKIPAQAIQKLAKLSTAASVIPQVKLIDLLKNLASKTNDSIIPGIELVQDDQGTTPKNVVKLEGTAVLKRDKMIGWFDTKETRGVLWIQGKVKSGIIVVPTPGDETKNSSIEIVKATSRILPERVDGNLELTVNVQVVGNLGEQMGYADLVKPEPFKVLKEEMTSAIKEEINSAVVKSQNWDVDILNFGTAVHRKFPKEWPNLEKNWPTEFQNIKVNVVVDANLHWTGSMKKTIQSSNKEGEDTK